jgi:hypothetical protein
VTQASSRADSKENQTYQTMAKIDIKNLFISTMQILYTYVSGGLNGVLRPSWFRFKISVLTRFSLAINFDIFMLNCILKRINSLETTVS